MIKRVFADKMQLSARLLDLIIEMEKQNDDEDDLLIYTYNKIIQRYDLPLTKITRNADNELDFCDCISKID